MFARSLQIEERRRSPNDPPDRAIGLGGALKAGTSTRPGPRGTAILLITATALGLGLRLIRLDRLGLEADEGLYSFIAGLPLEALPVYLSHHESTPPLFLLLLKAWQSIFESDAGIRLLPVIFGTAAIPVMFLAGRRILGAAGGLAAAFFMAVAPFHVYHSRIAKNPSLFFLLTLCALVGVLVASRRRARWPVWVVFTLALTGMLYTHGLAPVFIAGLGVIFLVGSKVPWKESLRPWLAAHVVAALLFLPWVGVALRQVGETLDNFWAPRPPITVPIATAAKFAVFRPSPPLVRAADLPLAGEWLAVHPAAGRIAGRLLAWLWLLPAGATFALTAWLLLAEGRRRALSMLVSLFAVPVGIVWLVSQLTASVYIDRALLPALIPIPLLLAAPFAFLPATRGEVGAREQGSPWAGGSTSGPPGEVGGFTPGPAGPARPWILRWALASSVASFFVLLFCSWHVTAARPGEEYREAAAVIRERALEGDALVFDAHFGQILFERYLGADAPRFTMYGVPVGVRDLEIPDWSPRVASEEDLAPLVTAASRHAGLWLVLSHTSIHDPRGLAAAWCSENLRQTETHRFVGVVLARYETPGD